MTAERASARDEALASRVPALEVEQLTFSYGARPALRDLSFRLWPGEFTVLLGPNGAGKSTLFALVTRLFEAPAEAEIRIFGVPLRRQPRQALARLGVVFQQPTLDPDLSVRENLLYHAALHGLSRAEAAAAALRELERIGIADRMRDRVRDLSGGQRRRVEIARALLTRPALLLLDEPTVGLDIASRGFLLSHLRRLVREDGLAVLWATHLIDEVDEQARVILLAAGEKRADGTLADLLARTGTATLADAFARLTRGEA